MSMMKLYWNESSRLNFTAKIVSLEIRDSATILTLNQTAFYPEGGGQPADRGTIDSLQVTDVQAGEDEKVRHFIAGQARFSVGQEVTCCVDAAHRLEMTQQHTGQHILSQAFFQLYGAETRGFRITDAGTEIDLTLELRQEEIAAAIHKAEDLANTVVFENREIRSHLLTPEDAAKLPLRKESFVTDCVRVIEIEDFDWSPCGGTHARRTGEVGLIAVKSHERAKQMTRVHFVCGVRTLRDYRAASQTAMAIAGKFSVARDEALASVERLWNENRESSRRLRALAEKIADVEAQELLKAAETISLSGEQALLVMKIFDDRGLEEIKLLAHRMIASQGVMVLLLAKEVESTRAVFARSSELRVDMNQLMRQACELRGWRGGGRPDFAQGGGTGTDNLDSLMTTLRQLLR